MLKFCPTPIGATLSRFFFRCLLSIFFLVSSLRVVAQIRPAEGSVLNYRIIGLSFPKKGHDTRSIIKIAIGHYDMVDDFKKHIHQIISTDSNKVVTEVPFFGKEYTWRVVYVADGKPIDSSNLYHFATAALQVESDRRLRVTKREKNHHGTYFLVDGMNAIFDADGNPVWFLPGTNLLKNSTDLKISSSGTLTFLSESSGYEVSYSGKVIWRTKDTILMPDGEKTGIIHHHEFTKINNGHFMALTAVVSGEKAINIDTERKRFFPIMSTGLIKVYNEESDEIWSWDGSAYANQSDIGAIMDSNSHEVWDLHENAFYFDEQTQIIYLCMSGIDRIVKIQYPSGKVLAEYGSKISRNERIDTEKTPRDIRTLYANKHFHNPHGLKFSPGGYLYLFGSSGIHTNAKAANMGNGYPKILNLKESGDSLKSVWELDCRKYIGEKKKGAGGGGNVIAISDGTLFVSMCLPHNEMFIVNKRKEILWSAVTEVYQQEEKTWGGYPKYRACVITREQMEQMVWSE